MLIAIQIKPKPEYTFSGLMFPKFQNATLKRINFKISEIKIVNQKNNYRIQIQVIVIDHFRK